ncbi:LOW QUALITY PROTEIN: dnaJ homolog subfamily C member 11-like [Amphiura filiformis]|uniref:LOW QUALITY PROTEIN: dnaJ homolog subfamily C member 11-like n=1 Tax=Amphiura filiformis TaxID=82378 RepID=UPI003B21DD97
MAAPMDDGDHNSDVNSDFYAILNSRKESSSEELKQAYRRLCMLYHPDKHTNAQDKQDAEVVFNKVQKAYTVLSDPEKRAIYDVYGEKGLEAEWDLVPRTRTPQEIRDEYERLSKEREERRLQQSTNPRGGITVGVDATDFFDVYDEYGDEFSGSPSLEVKSMTIQQSIDVPLTVNDTVTFSGHLATHNGNGTGNFTVSCRRILSHQSWGEFQASAGNGPSVAFKIFRNIGKRSFVTCTGLGHVTPRGLAPGLVTTAARQLDKHTMGYITWKWGLQSAMTTMIVRDTVKSHAVFSLQLGMPNSYASASYTRKFETDDTRLTVAVKAGMFGSHIEYGGEKGISHSRIGARLSIGVPHGITLRVKFHRANQAFIFPIHLSQEVIPNAIFYGTIAPLAIFWVVKVCVIDPFLLKEKEKDIEQQKNANKETLEQRRSEAESEVRLMQEMVRRITETESSKQGLIIVQAWYGKLVSIQASTEDGANELDTNVIDVTIPLQCQVKDSKLLLTDVSKANLPGFYDPCLGEDKSLRVRYQFRQGLHECTVTDKEPLRIPKQSHRLETS